MLTPKTKLGPYEILGPLGAGGMGEVYRARDTRVGREVAVKILPRDFAADPQRCRRFEQEARLAASLNHPNIVGLFDVGPDLDPPYIVSELVPGVSLRAVMSRGAIPLRKVLDLAAQMAEGLAAAHAAGVVHRDIKPENVMVTPEGRVKILDFGLARVQEGRGPASSGSQTVTVGPETPHPTSPGMVVGTVAYMSPEQASGHTVDYRSDQFSLGLVLYEMLARRRAFERGSTAQTMAAIIEDEAPPLPATVPTQVRWVVERCLAKDAPKRYASTLDLAHELRQLGEHISELTPASGESAMVTRRRGRRELRLLAAGAAALALVALAAGRLSVDEPLTNLTPYKLTPVATQMMTSYSPSWSPDGKSVAFLGKAEGAGVQVYVQRFDAPTPIQITQPPLFVYDCRLFWTPDSRMIYCTASLPDTQSASIYRIPVGGGDPVLVQRGMYWWGLSPDANTLLMLGVPEDRRGGGMQLLYASPPTGPRRLYEPTAFEGIKSGGGFLVASFAPNGAEVLIGFSGQRGSEYRLLPWPPGKSRRIFDGLGDCAGFSWMPDSRHLVLAAQPHPDPTQPNRLMMADARSGRYWSLLVSNTNAYTPAASPDGSRIAFTSNQGHRDIMEIPLHGGPARTLLGSSRNEQDPALSADGKELVYVSDPRGPVEVWSRQMNDGALRRILSVSELPSDSTHPVIALRNPALSRDKGRIAVIADAVGEGSRLFTAFTAGGTPVRVTTEETGSELGGTWSPDGTRLAYLSSGRVGGFHLALMRVGSSEQPILLEDSLYNVLPEWSPTGEWIAVASSARERLVLVSPDGGGKCDVGKKGTGGLHAWSPDGRTLYSINFAGPHAGWITAIDAQTGSERVVRDLGGFSATDFMPAGQRITVSADGNSLICGVGRSRSEIWLLEGARPPAPWYARLWP